MKEKIIVASFFPVYPVTFGSSVVISSFFENIPHADKLLFQISKIKIIKNKSIKNVFLLGETKFLKIISVFFLIKKIFLELKLSKKKNILIIEGASWIGYSFLLIFILKLFSIKVKIIYRGHSIEYEIRKKNSNIIISNLSYLFEKYVYKNSSISTSVSNLEKNKIKKLYNINTYLFPNIIKFTNQKFSKHKIKKKYIFYSGSYDYIPNKKAIDRLYFEIMPKLRLKKGDINLVLTGSKNIPHKADWLINLGLISKRQYFNVLHNAVCLIVPTKEGYGTRVKIIEALCCGTVVVSSKIGIEGIDYSKNNPPPFECASNQSFVNTVLKLVKTQKYKNVAIKNRYSYIKNYSAKEKTINFFKSIK